MTPQRMYLMGPSSTRIAALDVALTDDRYCGTICLDETPAYIKSLFDEFEEMVEAQVFSVADEIEEKIAAISLKVAFANGTEAYAEDLEVYPSTKRVSFKVRQPSLARR